MKYKILFFLLVVTINQVGGFSLSWDEEVEACKIEEALLKSAIISVKGLRKHFLDRKKAQEADWSNNAIKFVALKGGLNAVFKKGPYAYAEVAAYKASQELRLGLVPPTVLRTIDGEVGSLQLFIPSLGTLEKYKKKVPLKMVSDMHVFYFIFGQWDIHKGNQLVYKRGKNFRLALIDNAGMKHRQQVRYGEVPFVSKGIDLLRDSSFDSEKFPFSAARKVPFYSYDSFRKFILPFVNERNMKILWKKKNRVPYVIWHKILWMQIYKNSSVKPTFTSVYYASTVNAVKGLDRSCLERIWSEGRAVNAPYYDSLIDLTLERRDQLLKSALSKGFIKEG